ncbi:hypothetical protein FF38_11040 [Lucilia cuprina]|uniref:Large polyvalent protein-associated domain-containing protein n=1 Tax=Lucilia cuprina TaxID=7375 RepID=A0A0L0BZN0_LUCCU|nr:hypothetical protein FF38_11040 [Lucilia cuprina]
MKETVNVNGHTGTWCEIDSTEFNGEILYLMESEQYGENAPCLIIREDNTLFMEDVYNGFDELFEIY